jgi:hypothetical protein
METLGDAFVQQEPLDIGKAFAETSAATPLIFILGEEVDPCKYIFRFVTDARHKHLNTGLVQYSNGPKWSGY